MRILVTGSGGMLGQRLVEQGWRRAHHVIPVDLPSFDLGNPKEAAAIIRAEAPEAVIHTAALTDVDACESRSDEAMAINGLALGPLAKAAHEMGAYFLAIGTDYVFDGEKGEPYTVDDQPNPQTVYGGSKLLGESLALEAGGAVARLSWLFGPGGGNFVKTMAGLLSEGKDLKVVDDQIGRPTFTRDAAAAIMDLTEARAPGIWHISNGGWTSWYGFACAIAEGMGLSADEQIRPCSTKEYPRPAARPADSRLDTSLLDKQFSALQAWPDALTQYMEEEGWLVK
ncbi:dTDP-4-dehydrorhamnose reductase [bacterium]|nr:dTDP-4-dehydrorhamnose reductase [bacterium]